MILPLIYGSLRRMWVIKDSSGEVLSEYPASMLFFEEYSPDPTAGYPQEPRWPGPTAATP